MGNNKLFFIEVVYASVTEQRIITVEVAEGMTLEACIKKSGILTAFPEINLHTQKIGSFSKKRALSDVVKPGERIEIYRPLTIDPMEARRKREKKND